MPKIPMGSKAGAAPDQRAVAYLHNVPRMRYYGSDGTAEALINFGKSVEDTGGKISGAIGKTVSAREQFYLHQRNLDDQLAATGARNLYRGINSEVEERMASEPGNYSEFGKWAQEADKRYGEEVRAYTDKMSPDFRKRFELEMEGLRADTVYRRRLFGIHGETTAKKDVFRSQWKDAALRGDLGECRRQQEYAVKEKLIAPEENGRLTLEYNRLSAYGEVKRALDAGTPGLAAILKERNDDGGYKNHTGLAEADRDRFIRVAEAKATQMERDMDEEVLAGYADGNILISDEELKRRHDAGMITDRQYRTYKGWNETFRKEGKRSADYQASQQEKAVKASRKQQLERLLTDAEYDENGYPKTLDEPAFSDAFGKVKRICGNDYSLYSETMQKLNSLRGKDPSIQKTPLYKDGEGILTLWKKSGKMTAEGSFWRTDSSDEAKFFVERSLRIDMERFCADHPKASTKELYDFMNDKLKTYNTMRLEKIITTGGKGIRDVIGGANPHRYDKITVTAPDGWRFKGGDPSKKENWERTKI